MLVISFLIILRLFAANLNAQQSYPGNAVLNCNNTDDSGPSPSFLYTCNGEKNGCQAFLIFRSQPEYNSASTISNLTSSDAQKLAEINNISTSEILSLDREIIVPVECSCSGKYYQANTSYTILSDTDTYLIIANNTYQGLSTCDSMIRENPYGILDLKRGMNLKVPLRCACPTKDHIKQGINFLLTYLITWGDNIPDLSIRFNVSSRTVADANGFSEEDPTLYPFTTILIPLPRKPMSSQTRFDSSPPVVTAPPALLENVSRQKNKSWKGIYIGVAIGCFLGVTFCCLLLFFFFHRGIRIDTGHQKIKDRKKMTQLQTKIADIDHVLKIYAFDELKTATENFHPRRRLGDSVYRGVLRGKLSAIKKMSNEVSKEVEIFSKINHFNLISLYGACEENGVYYLVYEFMENGTLKEWLQQKEETCPETQSWNYRICIALDVAHGLDYLHNFTSPGYVHNHINSSNILLNTNLRAKIANFRLAKLAGAEENGNSSPRMVQEMKGYMAPEYLESGKVTSKVDVFAFGVVLFQLITGKEQVLLSETLISAKTREGTLIDPRLQVRHPLGFIIDQTEVAVRLVNLSAACMDHDPEKRPSMANIVSTLMKIQSDIYKPESISMEYAGKSCSDEL